MYCRFVIFLLVLFALPLKSQSGSSKEELLNNLQKTNPDTVIIDIYNELSWPVYSFDQPDSSIYYSLKAIELAKKINDTKRLSIAHRRIGIAYINKGEFKSSIYHQEESYALSEKINFREGKIKALNNLGVIYLNNELLNKALGYFLRSLKIMEESGDNSATASVYNNCGLIYMRTQEFNKAKQCFMKARSSVSKDYNADAIIEFDCHLSALFLKLNKTDSSRFFLDEATGLIGEKPNVKSKFSFLIAEGIYYSYIHQNQRALESFLKCEGLTMSTTDKITMLINIGEEYKNLKNVSKTVEYFEHAYRVSLEAKMYNNLMYLSKELAGIYKLQGNTRKFENYITLHLNYRDSNEKYIRVQSIKQQQLEFDYERKQVADSLKFLQREQLKDIELEVAEANLNKEKTFRIALILFLVMLVIFLGFLYNRFFIIRKQNRIIELQKELVELKNHEILDSINYAKRLQGAILPQIEDIRSALNFDIFYLPKDIIGGDFYFYDVHKGKIIVGVCDCTGHGIPGAIMSVVCHQALHKAIKEFDLLDPGLILGKTRELIIEQLNAENHNIKDGMDCSLLVIDAKSKKIKWAGANNPLWIGKDNMIAEIKSDKQPVALYENSREFNTSELDYVPGTNFYLLTDGFADQFGGEKGKKFKQKQLKEFLNLIGSSSPESQVLKLREKFSSWKGVLDQVDDVTVAIIAL